MQATRFTLPLYLSLALFSSPLYAAECGDTNADGVIDSFDALDIQRHITGLVPLTLDQLTRADVNGDSSITFDDVIWLLQYIGGNPLVTLRCPPVVTTKIYVATFSPSTITIIDKPTLTTTSVIPTAVDPIALAKDPTRESVYVLYFDQTLAVLDTTTDTLGLPQSVSGLVGSLEVTADGTALVGIKNNIAGAGLFVFDLPGLTLRHEVTIGGGFWGTGFLSLTDDSRYAWTTDTIFNNAVKVDLVTGTIEATVPVDLAPMGIDVSEDGSHVYVANNSGHSLSVIDTATSTEISRTLSTVLPTGALAHSNGHAYLAGNFFPELREHDGASGAETSNLPLSAAPYLLHETRDGEIAVVTFTTLKMHLVDPSSGDESVIAIPGPTTDVTSIARPWTPMRFDTGLRPSTPLISLGVRRLIR
jgi:hypothetical protein